MIRLTLQKAQSEIVFGNLWMCATNLKLERRVHSWHNRLSLSFTDLKSFSRHTVNSKLLQVVSIARESYFQILTWHKEIQLHGDTVARCKELWCCYNSTGVERG